MFKNSFENQVLAAIRTQSRAAWVGPPGSGKTAKLQYVLQRNRISAEIVLISLRDYQDVIGWPMPAKEPITLNGVKCNVIRYAPPGFGVRAASATREQPHAIIFDEVTCASPTQQAYFLRVFNEGVIGELELNPQNTAMLALFNPPEQAAGGFELTLPMATRLSQYEFDLDRDGWVQGFPTYWDNPPALGLGKYELDPSKWTWARSMVAGFIKQAGSIEKFHGVPKDQAAWSKPSPNARTWDKASRKLAYVLQEGGKAEESLPLMVGDVGHVATEFATWLKNKDLRDPEEVLADEIEAFKGHLKEDRWDTDKPSPFKVPDRGDIAYALLNSIASVVTAKLDPARGKAAWRILAAAAEQSQKDVAASAAIEFFKCWYQNSAKMPRIAKEVKPFEAFLTKMGKMVSTSRVA